ncbi:MAG: dATP/dGTP diphosphohydrolase domain-containing protein [Dehalococcoidia bacterium]
MTDKLVPVAGLEGDDDHSTIVVGRVFPDPVPREPSAAARSARAFVAVRKQRDIEALVKAYTPEPLPLSDDVDPASRDEAAAQPRAPHDKTDEWDMRDRGVPFSDASRGESLGQGADGGGQRLNAGKNRIELLPETWLWALADVMTQGSKKYDPRNWEKGMDWSAMVGCMHRHLGKFQSGQRYDGKEFDKEKGTTGCHELAMVAWNALALMHYDLTETGNNDLVSQQLDLFSRVNAATSDLGERHGEETT